MDKTKNHRREQRLYYDWPVRFAKGFEEELFMGQMVDICSWGSSFTCPINNNQLKPGENVTTLFSVPRFGRGRGQSYDMANYTRIGRICRVEKVDESLNRIAIQFTKPLFFKPGEQGVTDTDIKQRLGKDSQLSSQH